MKTSNNRKLPKFGLLLLIALAPNWPANKADSNYQFARRNQHKEDTANEHNEDPSRASEKCVPLLPRLSLSGANQGTESRVPGQFSFAFNDIDMPLSSEQQGGSNPLHSAMKLLSAFESHLYGDEDEDEPNEEKIESKNVIQFRQNKLHLSGLNLTMLNIHLYNESEPKFALGINIKNTTLYGSFHYNGPTPSLLAGSAVGQQQQRAAFSNGRSKLSGIYRMSIDNVLVIVGSNLTKVEKTSAPASAAKQFKLITNDFRLNITNLGYISIEILDASDPRKVTSNYLLRMLQRVLQKTIKRIYYSFEKNLIQTLELEGRKFFDCELTRFEPLLMVPQENPMKLTSNARGLDQVIKINNKTTSLEDLSRIISGEIANLNLSRVSLPDFDYQRQILGTSANIFFTNGSLSGLDNFKFNDETKIKLQGEHLLINASLGWFNLRPQYNWTLYLGSLGQKNRIQLAKADGQSSSSNVSMDAKVASSVEPSSSGFVAFNIKAIDFDAVISKGLGPSSKVVVDELIIRRLDGPKMEFSGLPGMNRLARGLVNFFMARLKQRLLISIQPALKRELEQILNRIQLLNLM